MFHTLGNGEAMAGDSVDTEVEERLAQARRLCARLGVRLSVQRLRTLELVLQAKGPVKAYDIAKRFYSYGKASAITVYRALKFWEEIGLVRRIKSLNAFVASLDGEAAPGFAFLVCSDCGESAEIPLASPAEVAAAAFGLGFEIDRLTLEAGGRCRRCVMRMIVVDEVEA